MRFKRYILNEDYMRFLNKNKNLTRQQKNEINDYFYKVNPHAGKKINWQSKEVNNWTYQDFMDLKQKYKSGIKSSNELNCNEIKVPVSSNEYVKIGMPTKEFCAFSPLTYDAAKAFNTRKLGVCSGPWCIGSTETFKHWNDIIINDNKVPIYVINNTSKWVVLIHQNNKAYEVWDVHNKENIAIYNKNPIPNFDIEKNLLSPKQRALYNKIRKKLKRELIDISDALNAYNRLIKDIEYAREEYDKLIGEFEKHNGAILRDTIKMYGDELNDIIDKIDDAKDNNDYDYMKELEGEKDDLYTILSDLNNTNVYDMSDITYIEWTDFPYDEQYIIDNEPTIDIEDYDEYFDLMEHYNNKGSYNVEDAINEYIKYDERWDDYSAEGILEYYDWYSPEVLNEE